MLHNRRRTALTMLGMAWGIADGGHASRLWRWFWRAIVNIFAELEPSFLSCFPAGLPCRPVGQKAGAQIRLTLDDVDLLSAISRRSPTSRPVATKTRSWQFDNRTYTMSVNGEYPNTFDIRALILVRALL